MCGIVGVVSNTPCKDILIEGLKKLEYRGYDSAGVAISAPAGNVNVLKSTGAPSLLEGKIEHSPNAELLTGTVGIAHTRWATHGKVTETNAHPHRAGRITVVHNGIIENYAELKAELKGQSEHQFVSETDSEVLAALLDYFVKQTSSMKQAILSMGETVKGAYGLVVIDSDEPDVIWVARSGSPMVIGLGQGANYVASDTLALNAHTESFIYLDEGEIACVKKDACDVFSSLGEALTPVIEHVPYLKEEDGHNGYGSFMEKEIAEQPAVIGRLVRNHLGENGIKIESALHQVKSKFDGAESIHIVACGTSFNAGLVAKHFFEHYTGLPISVEIASEYRYRTVAVPKNTAFICVSQSGETADTLAALRKAKASGYLTTLALCNVGSSAMVREADSHLMLQAGVEIGVASTKAFTTQLTAFLLLTIAMCKDEQKKSGLAKALMRLPADCESVLNVSDKIKKLAAPVFKETNSCLFLGRGEQSAIAAEGALKLKELSYIHAEAYAAGELKHGPLALIDDVIPVVVNAPGDTLSDKLASNVEEVNARGGRFVVFSAKDVHLHGERIVNITMPDVPLETAAVTYAIPLQLLAYHVTLLRGENVDKPRNLAKAVSVE